VGVLVGCGKLVSLAAGKPVSGVQDVLAESLEEGNIGPKRGVGVN